MYIHIERNLYTYQTKPIYISINRYIGFFGVGECALFMHEEECLLRGVSWRRGSAIMLV